MDKKSYSQKLLDPRWQKKRLEVLSENDFTCSSCGATHKTLHVHHRKYFKGREPWEYDAGQLEVLCKDCHADKHGEEDPLDLAVSFVGSKGKTPRDRHELASFVDGAMLKYGHDNFGDCGPEEYFLGVVYAFLQVRRVSIDGLLALRDLAMNDQARLVRLIDLLGSKHIQKKEQSK